MVLETTGNSLKRKSIYINDSKSLAFDTTPLSASSTYGLSLSAHALTQSPADSQRESHPHGAKTVLESQAKCSKLQIRESRYNIQNRSHTYTMGVIWFL